MFTAQPAPSSRVHHKLIVRLYIGWDFGSLRQSRALRFLRKGFASRRVKQSGQPRFAFVALLLLALPVVFTFHVLFALPRLAERKRQFWVQPTSHLVYGKAEYRLWSESRHALIRLRVSIVRWLQYTTRLVVRWKMRLAISIRLSRILHSAAARSWYSLRSL